MSTIPGLPLSGSVRVLIAAKPVDFRKGADGLAALAKEVLAQDPFSGAIIVFRAKRADRVKISGLGRQRPGAKELSSQMCPAKLVNLWPASRLDELMPWAWAARRSTDRLAA